MNNNEKLFRHYELLCEEVDANNKVKIQSASNSEIPKFPCSNFLFFAESDNLNLEFFENVFSDACS